ncbi:heparinase II/III family protein [Mycolicibacterium frederiksbergense]|uniref:Heparinase II/III-like C-terminal domain-containing protein n=1 Tax=Mycolicibacterium frederiksbergense TaxID=117567 RepID=A0A6H0S0S6_9MYCO|nr:heparinase II/III family protein [Mycolicibacterium frederiksbergense]QIV81162.1 hypothetical protein EXE63_09850 [Mycolicibacterium frederiksbergense]
MAVFQVKRIVRNKAVPRFANLYEQSIRSTAADLPVVLECHNVPTALASFVGQFYAHTPSELDDAAGGKFEILGRTVDFESIEAIDWCHQLPDERDIHLWRMKLGQLEVVHSLVASGDPAHQRIAIALLSRFGRWRSFAEPDAFAVGWSPYCASHRLLALVSGVAIAMQQDNLAEDLRVPLAAFARLDAGFVWRNIEYELRNNHTERNLAALCLYHLAAESISPKQAKVLDRETSRIIRATVLADGTQVERSAMYQGLTVMSLRIFASCPFLSAATRKLAAERGAAAERAWLFLTHEDGDIALFNDSWIGEVPAPGGLLHKKVDADAGALASGGYQRLSSGGLSLIMDSGAIGPRWNPGHGHADFLALEVDVDGCRFIVDPGTSLYCTGRQRDRDRGAARHNGPLYVGSEPVIFADCFKVGRYTRAVPIPQTTLSHLSVPAIGGRVSTADGQCSRLVAAVPGGGVLVVDRWSKRSRAGRTTLLISSEWVIGTKDPSELTAQRGRYSTRLVVVNGKLALDTDTWSRRYLQVEEATAAVLSPVSDGLGGQVLVFGIGITRIEEAERLYGEITRGSAQKTEPRWL